MQRFFALWLVFCVLILSSCKTTTPTVNRRHTKTPKDDKKGESASQVEVQQVTSDEIESLPPLPPPPPANISVQKIVLPEVGSECKVPVTANCLKIPFPVTTISVLNLSPEILKKYSRQLTPAEHNCAYFNRQLPAWSNISYFPDAVVYWSNRDDKSVIYNSLPLNFIYSAGCEVGSDLPNPYAAELKATTSWDGQTTLKSLGYKLGTGQALPANFAIDKLKAEKVTQASQACTFAVRPMIYVFPDGVIYQFVGGTLINIYPMTQVQGFPCSTPPQMMETITALLPKCNSGQENPDPTQRKTLQGIGLAPQINNLNAKRYLSQERIDALELNGKSISNSLLECPAFAVRTNVRQFKDGIAFISNNCTDVNVYSNEYLKTIPCKIPELP